MDILANYEEQLIATGRGKWSQLNVPHGGWQCVNIEDMGTREDTCEMCESKLIRYVHYMEHDNFPDVLRVGCVCAGHMEGDVAAARKREAFMRSRGDKRKRWLSRKWKISKKGNPWVKADGYRITIYKRVSGWAWAIGSEEDDSPVKRSEKDYRTEEQAKLAAFDYMTVRPSN